MNSSNLVSRTSGEFSILSFVFLFFFHFQDDELEEETSLLNASAHDEDAILKSPQGSTTSKSPDELPASAPLGQQQKKVILKRKLITTISVNDSDDAKTETASASSAEASASKCAKIDDDSADATNGDGIDKKVVKLTELTMKERLELRAKKFGATPSVDALKQARAERFGISADAKTAATSNGSTGKIIASAPVSVDVLKKRAERFGGSVSTVMNKIENKEKLLKRQERFGANATSTRATVTADPKAASEYAEKAKLRLERFKTIVK